MNSLIKPGNKLLRISIDRSISEIDIDLSIPRLIEIRGKDHKGKEISWHLKITEKHRLVLL